MPEMAQRASVSTNPMTLTGNPRPKPALPEDDGGPPAPESIPPWVHLIFDDSPAAPTPSRPNTRHYRPPPQHYRPGRKWDHQRDSEPALLGAPIAERQALWKPFMHSGPSPEHGGDAEGATLMSPEWAEENMAIVRRKWEENDEAEVDRNARAKGFWIFSPARRERTMRVFWRLLLKNPFVPLVFRITVLAFSAAALGIAANIHRSVTSANSDLDPNNQCSTSASTYMALVVGSLALPYILYVTWDEYTSKPLGLRSAFAKTSLLLVDLYFIVFSASNLSLAFDALFDHRWACYDDQYQVVGQPDAVVPSTCPDNPAICYKQKTLSAVLFLSLIAWLITFGISVMRVVEKLRV